MGDFRRKTEEEYLTIKINNYIFDYFYDNHLGWTSCDFLYDIESALKSYSGYVGLAMIASGRRKIEESEMSDDKKILLKTYETIEDYTTKRYPLKDANYYMFALKTIFDL